MSMRSPSAGHWFSHGSLRGERHPGWVLVLRQGSQWWTRNSLPEQRGSEKGQERTAQAQLPSTLPPHREGWWKEETILSGGGWEEGAPAQAAKCLP